MSEWQDPSTAPKDARKIDLWVISDSDPVGWRVPDCHRSYGAGKWPDVWIRPDGHYVAGSTYWDEDDECFKPGQVPHPKARNWTKVTHWMAKPAPPHSVPEKGDDDA